MNEVIQHVYRDNVGSLLLALNILTTDQADAVASWLVKNPDRMRELDGYLARYDSKVRPTGNGYYDVHVPRNKFNTNTVAKQVGCKSIW